MADELLDLSVFAVWLQGEIKKRNMSVREFARFCGDLSHGTIFRYASGEKQKEYPPLDTIFRIARATVTDPCEIIMMIMPDDLRSSIAAEDRTLSLRISLLNDDWKQKIDVILASAAFDSLQKGD